MIQQGNTIIMTVEELELDRRRVVMTTIELLNKDKLEKPMCAVDAANYLGVEVETLHSYTRRKNKRLNHLGSGKTKKFTKEILDAFLEQN